MILFVCVCTKIFLNLLRRIEEYQVSYRRKNCDIARTNNFSSNALTFDYTKLLRTIYIIFNFCNVICVIVYVQKRFNH